MRTSFLLALTVCLCLCVADLPAAGPAQATPPGIEEMTTLSPEHLADMDQFRRSNASVGQLHVTDAVVKRAGQFQKLLQAGRQDEVVRTLLASYATDQATVDLPALAIALGTRADYIKKCREIPDSFYANPKSRDENPKQLVATVLPIVEKLAAGDSPYARDAAVELLLQVSAEGLTSQHATSGNGNRKIPPVPEPITARAAEFLGAPDPFVAAMAEWAIHVKVSNDNDEKSKDNPWPGKNPPAWYKAWETFLSPENYLQLDYTRQAISLGMHRRGSDLLTLAKHVAQRAQGKAIWAKDKLPTEQARKIDQAVAQMQKGLAQLEAAIQASPDDLTACRKAWLAWRPLARAVAMQGPDVNFDSLVYFKRFSGGAHLQPGIHDAKFPDGGDIYVQKGLDPTSPTRALLGDKVPSGVITDMDLWYDADKLVFTRTDERRVQKLYQIDLTGRNLKKLTEGNYDDCDPAWLPDGTIVFGSMQAAAGTMCASALGNVGPGGASHTNLYRLMPDGTRRRLSYCKDDDCYPYVLNDGRIVWMRWDYQERGVDEIFSLWVIRPDGTGSDGYYRVHIPDSLIIQSLRDPRPIEGTNLILATGGSHRSGNEGLLIVADPDMGINNPDGVRTVTPFASPISRGCGSQMRAVPEGGVPYLGGYVTKPWALSEKSFLVSMGFDMPQSSNFWVYYVDAWGNKELIHRDKLMEAVAVAPVRKRAKPPVLPDLADPTKTYATCYVDNVYADLPNVEKGEVKYLRIAQQMFWITRAGEPGLQYHPLANASECFGYPGTGGPVRVFGLVPVEVDGSAHFQVPAGVDLYFQALDENYRAVQRMRTHVEFAPGENRSCIGCHETKDVAVKIRPKGIALAKAPVRPAPPHWGDTTLIDYEKMIQPIFSAKCVKCHGNEKAKGGLNLSDKRDKYGFMQGYRAMFGLKPEDPTSNVVWTREGEVKKERFRGDRHPWYDIMYDYVIVRRSVRGEDSLVTPTKKYGAIAHPLITTLLEKKSHHKLLTDEELRMLVTWFDIQAPYFDTYMQQVRRGRDRSIERVRVDPWEPFGPVREHTIHRPGPLEQANAK